MCVREDGHLQLVLLKERAWTGAKGAVVQVGDVWAQEKVFLHEDVLSRGL